MLRCVLILLLFLTASCARPPEPVWTKVPTAADLLQRLDETTGKVASLDTAASVSLTIDGKYLSSQQFLLVEQPNRLRVDVLTGFGQLILQLTSDGEELAVFLNTTVPGRFFRGAASDENLARFTRLPLSASRMVRLLLYSPSLIAYRQSEVSVVDEGKLKLRLIGETREQELLFDQQLHLIGCRYLAHAELFLGVQYLKLDADDQFPRRIQIELPAEKTRLAFNFTELKTNVGIDSALFRLKKPANIPVEVLP